MHARPRDIAQLMAPLPGRRANTAALPSTATSGTHREHSRVDGLLELPPVEDHATPGSAQALVRGRGHDVRVLEGARDHASSHKAGDVRHVGQQVRAMLVADLAHALVVNVPGGGRDVWAGSRVRSHKQKRRVKV